VDTPSFLMKMTQSSGATLANSGTNGGSFAVTNHDSSAEVEGTDFSWHAGAGPYSNGYLQSTTNKGVKQVWLSTSATAPSGTLENMNVAIGFRVDSGGFQNNRFDPLDCSSSNGGFAMSFKGAVGGGDFDMDTWSVTNSGSGTISATTFPTGLLFATDYIFAMSLDVTTGGAAAVQARFKFGGNAVQSPATADWTTFTLESAWPYFLRSRTLSNYFGMTGRVNFIALQRGGNAWSSSDLGTITSDPTQIPGWTPVTRIPRMGLLGVG
jgi:hypothetical protein